MKNKSTKGTLLNLAQATIISFGVGVRKGNPRRCLGCGEPIKRGEPWRKDMSPENPGFGRYSIIRHSPKCPDQKAYRAFQKSLRSRN